MEDIRNILRNLGQEHLLQNWDRLSSDEKLTLSSDILSLDASFIQQFREAIHQKPKKIEGKPVSSTEKVGNPHYRKAGLQLAKEGKVGNILIAGGMGTRLGFDGPKGCFPLNGKTLFERFAEKVKKASKEAGTELISSIMTSPLNDLATKEYFEKNEYFGLKKQQIHFFTQGTFPLLDINENLFLSSDDQIAKGPSGNGVVFHHFFEQGLYDLFSHHGIESVNISLVDNALADPFDFDLIGFQASRGLDVAIKCIEREDMQEKVGLLVETTQGIRVAEYSEVTPEQFRSPQFNLANLSLYATSLPFIHKAGQGVHELPLHVHKRNNAYKCEKFIFDNFCFAEKIAPLIYPRISCFAPIKDPESVTKAIV